MGLQLDEPTSCSSSSIKSIPYDPISIASSEKIRDPHISPSGKQVIYQVTPFYRPTDNATSALWIASLDLTGGVEWEWTPSKVLTNGEWNDHKHAWHPDSRRVFFLSDRGKEGRKVKVLCCMSIDEGEEQLEIVYDGPGSVGAFEISPGGEFVAFTTTAKSTSTNESKATYKATSLHVLHLSSIPSTQPTTASKETYTILTTSEPSLLFTWTGLSDITYRHRVQAQSTDSKSIFHSSFQTHTVRIDPEHDYTPTSIPLPLSTSMQQPHSTVLMSSGTRVELDKYDPNEVMSARALYVRTEGSEWRMYGEKEDAVRIVNLGTHAYIGVQMELVAVEVAHGVETGIDIVDISPCSSTSANGKEDLDDGPRMVMTLFETREDAIWFNAWDARYIPPSHSGDEDTQGEGYFVFSVILSSCSRNAPPDLWVGKLSPCSERPLTYESMRRIVSPHFSYLREGPPRIRSEVWNFESFDGLALTGIARFPASYDSASGRRLPTVLMIHGGPYRRDILDHIPYISNWRELLSSAGYLVLSCNYRGSQGGGHSLASTHNVSLPNMWADCESMLSYGIHERKVVDGEHVGVAGWSHGGTLAAYGATVRGNRDSGFFGRVRGLEGVEMRVGIVGAGQSDFVRSGEEWIDPKSMVKYVGNLSITPSPFPSRSEYPYHTTSPSHASLETDFLTSIGGTHPPNLQSCNAAILLLHGSADKMIPISQSHYFLSQIQRKGGGERAKEGSKLVVYQGEPHGLERRKNAVDVLEQVLEHCERWL